MGLCSLHHLLLSLFMTFSCSFKVQCSITLCKLKIAFVYARKKSGKQLRKCRLSDFAVWDTTVKGGWCLGLLFWVDFFFFNEC